MFSNLVKLFWPSKAFHIIVGDIESYMGVNCRGLAEMTAEQIAWLNTHKPIAISIGVNDVIIKYRKNDKYAALVIG